MAFFSPIFAPLRVLGSYVTAARLRVRRFRNTGRHAMRGKVARTAP